MKALLLIVLSAVLAAPSLLAAGPTLELDAQIVWTDRSPRFGGFSGLEIQDQGRALLTISDRASWARAQLERDEDGTLQRIRLTGIGPLLSIKGTLLDGLDTDAEGLAMDRQGTAYVSFEHFHRVRRYPKIDGPAEYVPSPPEFSDFQPNSGLEALAIDADDVLYAIPERSGAETRPFPVFRLKQGRWDQQMSIPRRGKLLVTDADFGPDGRFYLLERHFQFVGGFAIRIRSFSLGATGFEDEHTLLETRLGDNLLDNMEGISVWQDVLGQIRVTLISDDNFNLLQRTLISEYILHPDSQE
ncbi:MAG: esterase-like activity of phytase family protein [Pseudomonadota bacterium]